MAISADHVIETFGTATEENQVSSLREHQVVNLPAESYDVVNSKRIVWNLRSEMR